jgi:hypothetical protein
MQSCIATILHPLTITSSRKYHESQLARPVQPAITSMSVGVMRSFPMFEQDAMEEASITTRIPRMLQIDHHLIRDQGFNRRLWE